LIEPAGRGRSARPGPDWVRDAVFYQIFPDRFATSVRVPKPGTVERWDAPPTTHGFKGGDLLGIAEHLDELQELGITALYLTPIFASASNHRYHTYDYEFVDPLLGGDAALRELLDSAHARGMRVVLDGVFNHASRGFWPFHHVLENGAASPYRDWFILDPDVLSGRRGLNAYPGVRVAEAIGRLQSGADATGATGADATGAVVPGHGPASASQRILGYEAWWDLPALPELNHSNPEVREYVYRVAERWLRFGIDGWRLDVPADIKVPGFWEEFRRRCMAVNPEAYLVGEIWNPAPDWLAGDRFDALMNYPLAEAILSYTGAGRLDRDLVAKTHEFSRHVHDADGTEFGRWLTAVMATYSPEVTSLQLNLLDSHDTPRFLSLAGGDATALRLAALIQMTLPGAPCIYYGDEVGLLGREDPDCRRAYPWDVSRQDRELRAFIAGLTAMRRASPLLRRGRVEFLGAEGMAVAYRLFDLESSSRAGPSSGRRALETRPSGESRPTDNGPASRPYTSMVVVVNAGESPARVGFGFPEQADAVVEQVSWPGCEWSSTFVTRPLEEGTLVVEMEAREGVVLGVLPTL
jgi:cyclomaltodextrinase / maltogenic alpha-amylase / neopullulanase